jgi:hypothetical protein
MNEFLTNLKRQAEENPMIALAAGAAVVTAIAKFLSAGSEARNSRAWAKEVKRRTRKDQFGR